jgi:putative hydrolase of the HAD superfamily
MQPLAYLVDFDGTLYRSTPVKLAMAVELACFGWGSARLLRRFRHAHEELRATPADAQDSPFDQQIRHTAKALGTSPDHVRKVVDNWMFERPRKWIKRSLRHALIEELRTAQANGAKLAVVSDYPASFKLSALAGQLTFDTVVSNGEPGGPANLKPDPEGYLLAAARLGIAPERCLVVGDRADADGEAARRAGMPFRLVG